MAKTDFKSVDDYIASQPDAVRGLLERVRTIIRKAVPGAAEVISYQIPTYKLHGRPVLYFAGWKRHYSLYPATGQLVAAFKVADGHVAQRIFENCGRQIHLLLSDVVMPEIGGRQLADRLQSMNAELKVLFMSGYTDDGVIHHRVLEPGTAFLQKPFTPDALSRKVREVLDQR